MLLKFLVLCINGLCGLREGIPRVSDLTPITMHLFPPSRELEAEIYHLGERLEELQDHMGQAQGEPEQCRPDLRDSTPAMSFLSRPVHLASGPASSPAVQTYHEVLPCSITLGQSPFLSFIHSMLISSYTFRKCVLHSRPHDTLQGFSEHRRWRR